MSLWTVGSQNVYAIDSFTKETTHELKIGGSLNCNGSISIRNGRNIVTALNAPMHYAISAVGPVKLAHGESNGSIYYKESLDVNRSWDTRRHATIQYNNLPGKQDEHDIVGYLMYLNSIPRNEDALFVNNMYILSGNRVHDVNMYDIMYQHTSTGVQVTSVSDAIHLVRVSNTGNVNISNVKMNMNNVLPPENIMFTFNATSITIRDSIIIGSIYAPNSNVVISNSEIRGSLVAKTVHVTGNTVFLHFPFVGRFSQPRPPRIWIEPEPSLGNYNPIQITINNESVIPAYYEIRYTIDGTTPTRSSTLYSGSFQLYSIGIVVLKVKLFGNGVSDGELLENVYEFKCKTSNPTIEKNETTGKYSITSDPNSVIYYTLDGSTPTVDGIRYTQESFESIFNTEGVYYIKAIAVLPNCEPSDFIEEKIIVELPIGDIQIPNVILWGRDNTILATITPTDSRLKKTIIFGKKPIGEPPDHTVVEMLTGTLFTREYIEQMKISFSFANPDTSRRVKVKYSTDGSNPTRGIEVVSTSLQDVTIPFTDIKTHGIRAFTQSDGFQCSKQIHYFFRFRIDTTPPLDTTLYELRSLEVQNAMQSSSNYATDIAWIGPGIVTDDYAVYQALVNILSTNILERVFNPMFGVTILSNIAEIHTISNSSELINNLKSEIEYQDQRIMIREDMSHAYFDDSINSLVVDLVWVNNINKQESSIKYAYEIV